MLRFHSRFVALVFASSLACSETDQDPTLEPEMIEAERESETSGWWLRVVEDQWDLAYVEDLELNLVIDPSTLPTDIAGVAHAESLIEVGGPTGSTLKVKLKVVVIPAGPPAD